MSITYQKEKLVEILPEMIELIREHYEEIAWHKEKIKLNPDWGKYLELEEKDFLFILTVRKDTTLVGYAWFLVMPHLHHRDHIFAVNDVLFLKKEYRKGLTGVRLIKKAEQTLSQLNVSKVYITGKRDTVLCKILTKIGYEKEEENFSKYIGD